MTLETLPEKFLEMTPKKSKKKLFLSFENSVVARGVTKESFCSSTIIGESCYSFAVARERGTPERPTIVVVKREVKREFGKRGRGRWRERGT